MRLARRKSLGDLLIQKSEADGCSAYQKELDRIELPSSKESSKQPTEDAALLYQQAAQAAQTGPSHGGRRSNPCPKKRGVAAGSSRATSAPFAQSRKATSLSTSLTCTRSVVDTVAA